MTEQEKREMAIEEMGSDIEKLRCGKYHDCSSCDSGDYMFCQSHKLAKRLYDAGYRKQEVRKMKKQEMTDEIVVYLMTMHGYCRGKAENFAEDIVDYILDKIDDKKE